MFELFFSSRDSGGSDDDGGNAGGENFFAEFFGELRILGQILANLFAALAEMRFAKFEPGAQSDGLVFGRLQDRARRLRS